MCCFLCIVLKFLTVNSFPKSNIVRKRTLSFLGKVNIAPINAETVFLLPMTFSVMVFKF